MPKHIVLFDNKPESLDENRGFLIDSMWVKYKAGLSVAFKEICVFCF